MGPQVLIYIRIIRKAAPIRLDLAAKNAGKCEGIIAC